MNHTTYLLLLILINIGNCQPDQNERWAYGLLSSFGVSLIGFVISGLIILIKKYSKRISTASATKVLIGFAIGALLGDAFIHLIPEAFNTSEEHAHRRILEEEFIENDEQENQDEKRYLSSLTLICGVLAFFLIEKFMIFLEGLGQTSIAPITNENEIDQEQENTPVQSQSDNEIKKLKEKQEQHYLDICKCSISQQLFQITSWKHKPTLGYLNLVSDFLHNIMDGLAIGVLFASSEENNFRDTAATMIAIIVHEIAQEIGDTSILLENKFTYSQALLSNGIINLSAFIGCLIGLGIGSIENQNYVYAFVAGNFIYISCVDMIPEVLKESNYKVAFMQFIGIVSSMAIMYGLAIYEHNSE